MLRIDEEYPLEMLRTQTYIGRPRLLTWGVLAVSALAALLAVTFAQMGAAAQSDQLIFKIEKEYDIAIAGAQPEDRFGSAVSVGDIDSDGQADILIGAPESGLESRFRAGAVFGFLGPIDEAVTDALQAAIRFKGFDFTAGIGSAVLIRDVDQDGIADLLISSEEMKVDDNRQSSGLIFAALGPVEATGPSAQEIAERADFRILGPHRNFNSGKGLAAGDLNNDGMPDIAVGSPGGYELRRGGVEILLGPFDGLDIDLRDGADATLVGSVGNISSTRKGDGVGASIAIGDLNGDGIDDLAVNARSADVGDVENAGETYVVFGPLETHEGEVKSLADVTLQGELWRDEASESALAIGDLNGDGLNELVVGSMQSDVSGNRAAGKVFVLEGPLSPGIFNLENAAGIVVEGAKAVDTLGAGVGVGDVNGDGTADLVLAASLADPDSDKENAGIVYVMFGNIFERESTPADARLPQIALGFAAVVAIVALAVLIWWLRRIRRGTVLS